MIFYSDTAYYNRFEHMGCICLEFTNVKIHGCVMLKQSQWPTGFLFESDDQFDVYCAMMHGFSPAKITDEEYYEFATNKILFLSKARSKEFRAKVTDLRIRLNTR